MSEFLGFSFNSQVLRWLNLPDMFFSVSEDVDIDLRDYVKPDRFNGTITRKVGTDQLPPDLSIVSGRYLRGEVTEEVNRTIQFVATEDGVSVDSPEFDITVEDMAYSEWTNPTISNLVSGETLDQFKGHIFTSGDGVLFFAEFRVRKTSDWTTIDPRLTLPVATTSPSRMMGGGQGYGGSETKFDLTKSDELIWVLDNTDKRIYVIDLDGNSVSSRDIVLIDSVFTGVGSLVGCVYIDGCLYVYIAGTAYCLDATTGERISANDISGLDFSAGFTYDGTDLINYRLVTDAAHQIRAYNLSTGNEVTSKRVNSPVDMDHAIGAIAYGNGYYWIADTTDDEIVCVDPSNGNEVAANTFSTSTSIAIAGMFYRNGFLYAAELRSGSETIGRYNASTGARESVATLPSFIDAPQGMALSPDKAIAVNFEGNDYTTAIAQCSLQGNLIQVNIEKMQRNNGDTFISISGSYEK